MAASLREAAAESKDPYSRLKNRVGGIVTSLLLGILMLGSTVHAQRNERVIKANIPFDFVVGSESFPAGHYSVALLGPVLLELRDAQAAP